MSKENFDQVRDAYSQVKNTISALRAEFDQTLLDIDAAEEELRVLPLAPVPLDDLKAAVLDFVDAAGERHAEKFRGAIASFANGNTAFNSVPFGSGKQQLKDVGKPIGFNILEGGIMGDELSLARAQILNPDTYFDDQVLYYFCGPLIREGLRKIMDRMGPEEFGYDKIHPNKVGSPRRERRATIAAVQDRLAGLNQRKMDLAAKLSVLGAPVTISRRVK